MEVGREAADDVAAVAAGGGQVNAALLRAVAAPLLADPLQRAALADDAEVEAAAAVDVLQVASGTAADTRGGSLASPYRHEHEIRGRDMEVGGGLITRDHGARLLNFRLVLYKALDTAST